MRQQENSQYLKEKHGRRKLDEKLMRNGRKHVQPTDFPFSVCSSVSLSDSLGVCGVELGLVVGASRGVARKLFLFS